MSFQEEFKSFKNKESAPTPAAPEAPVEAAQEQPTHVGTEMFNQGLEAQPEPIETKMEDVAVEGQAPQVDIPEPKQGKIRIGTHEFDSLEEATKYANDLEAAMIQQQAYEQGKADAAPKEEAPPEKAFEEEMEEMIFQDPKNAVAKIMEKIKNDIRNEYLEAEKAKEQARVQAETRKKTWDAFYQKNSDLAKSQELVDFVLQRNPELLKKPADIALAELAQKTRAMINSQRETQLPTQELQSKTVIAPQGGQPSTATKSMPTEKAIDFISQVRKLNRNKAAQAD